MLGFGLALTLAVTLLFGLAPALRASAVDPARALKGGSDPHSRGRTMRVLIAIQVAFCFLVLFVAGLFTATFDRLSHRPTGFFAERLLTLETVTQRAEAPIYWDQVAEHLRAVPGVETVALSKWPLLSNNSSNGFVSISGSPPDPVLAYFLSVSPGWIDAMKMRLIDGRDFRESDTSPGVAIVNQTFVKQYFHEGSPIGKQFNRGLLGYQVVGIVRDASYRSMREPILPVAYVPIHSIDAKGAMQPMSDATLTVRTSGPNPLAIASTLRREVPAARPEFRVSNIRTVEELVSAQTVRERLLAMLALFFAIVALLLAGIGLYGVLDYSVLQRRKEIGIRMAIGAQAGHIARGVTADVFLMVFAGALAGIALGFGSIRYIQTLLYEVKPGDPMMLAIPLLTILTAALAAAVPAVIRAVRIDPVNSLRSE